MNRLKNLLLPLAGALSAVISFLIAAPYVNTLNRPWLKPDDPVSHFTFGTVWTNVQHAAFGVLLCGSFCFILESGRRSWPKVLQATGIGMILGGVSNSCADSGADFIGISAMKTMGPAGQFLGSLSWFVLVPLALSFSITLAIGPTKQRVNRAIFATIVAAPITFVGKIIGSIGAAIFMIAKMAGDLTKISRGTDLAYAVPAFLVEAIFVGIALGLTMLIADRTARAGSVRLIYGRNEFKDWSLDHTANRIGSSEVEIPVRGFKGVEAVHACIYRQGNQFLLDCQQAPGRLNGHPVSQAILNHGDVIHLGDAQLVFCSRGAVRQTGREWGYQQSMAAPPPQIYGQSPSVSSYSVPPQTIPPSSFQPAAHPFPSATSSRYVLIDLAGKEYSLQPGVNTIGRETGNSICIAQNSTVSRSHAQIVIDNAGAVVSDLGSANGSGLNGQPVLGPVNLSDGDTVAFGSANLRFRVIS